MKLIRNSSTAEKALVLAAVLMATGAWLFSQYWFHLPRLIMSIVDPIGEFQEVTWQQGPLKASDDPQPPNIVLIVVDDLGFNDITFYGGGIAGGSVPTPNIDSIASAGIHFPNGYAGNATCAPSRAALLTGRFGTRSGFEFTPVNPQMARFTNTLTPTDDFIEENAVNYPPVESLGLPASELTIPEMLDAEGYHSVGIGKWHLGRAEGIKPLDQGFDEWLGFLAGGALFMDQDDPNAVNSMQEFDPIDKYLWANLQFAVRYNDEPRFPPDSHMTDYFSRQAVRAIEANKNRPFFMYLAYNAPHTPLQSEKADYDALSHIEDHVERTYAGMIRGLDRGIGQVLLALEEHDINDNTIVVFTSDNGGAHYVGLSNLNQPYRGWKMTFFEGGIHTPFFIRWPDKIPVNSQYNSAVAHVDIFSTILAAAGVEVPGDRVIDGVDLMSYVMAEPQIELDRPLYWRTAGYKVVQQNGWKLQLQEQNGMAWLYNLNEDPTELTNLAELMPGKLAELTEVLYELDKDMVEPLWPALSQGRVTVDHTLRAPPEGEHEMVIWTN